MADDELEGMMQAIWNIYVNALNRPDRTLERLAPVPGAPENDYYRLYYLSLIDPDDSYPELAQVESPFDHRAEQVPAFIAAAISKMDELLCVVTDNVQAYEREGYLAFRSLEEARNALECLAAEACTAVKSGYGMIEAAVFRCAPASFSRACNVGMGERAPGLDLMFHRYDHSGYAVS